jgi:phosphoribosyl 1,2-cyclic phosphodiesterase
MLVRFWGTRGSIPVAMTSAEVKRKLVTALVAAAGRELDTPGKASTFVEEELAFSVSHTFGGNSSCVQIEPGGPDYVLCDLGSGARVLGNNVLATGGPNGHRFHVFMSHLHWDHIMGFPFFMPAYLPGNHVRIYGCHDALEEAFRRQNAAPSFPVDFSRMAARIEFIRLEPERDYDIAGLRVRAKRQHHGGDSYGYRIERAGKVVVYSTDSEHKQDDPKEVEAFVEFFREADLVIFDAQYSLADAISVKEDWGHSSNVVGVEMCATRPGEAPVPLPSRADLRRRRIATLLAETRRLERSPAAGTVYAAYDGLEIPL